MFQFYDLHAYVIDKNDGFGMFGRVRKVKGSENELMPFFEAPYIF